jgi:hypothetical protein
MKWGGSFGQDCKTQKERHDKDTSHAQRFSLQLDRDVTMAEKILERYVTQ